MNLILFMCCYSALISITDSKLFRLLLDDEIYPYTLQQNVPTVQEYFNIQNLSYEQIDDDQVRLGGFLLSLQSMDPLLPMSATLLTQYRENSIWKEGQLRLTVPNACTEFLNPTQFWYNITKLWNNCPPKTGDKWNIESQIIDAQINVPSSFGNWPWRGYILFSQKIFGKTSQFGVMLQVELIEIV